MGSAQLSFQNGAHERLLALTGGHAFWLQFLCHRIFENATMSNDFVVSDAVVQSSFSAILDDPGCKPQFYLLYQEVDHDNDAFDLLKQVAASACNVGMPVNLSDLFPDKDDLGRIGKGLKKLIDNQVVVLVDAAGTPSVRFRVEALRAWLRNNLLIL
jgi:hypothetical protein